MKLSDIRKRIKPISAFKLSEVADAHCTGIYFDVEDVDVLSLAIALVLVQQFSLAKKLTIDDTTPLVDISLEQSQIDSIIFRRLKPPNKYHRDGYLFQLMMWLSSHLDLQIGDLISLPHSQASAKGQDSLIIHRSSEAIGLSICEDKATINPRETILAQVWPEITEYEKGDRDDELRSATINILGTGGIDVEEAETLIKGISWNGKRRYRVRVTIEDERSKNLFKGFTGIVAGADERRRGETVLLPDMRNWMDGLALKIEAHLQKFVKAK